MSFRLLSIVKQFRWYHWAGGAATAGAMNAGLLIAIGKSYHWIYSDYFDEVKKFSRKYGRPSEEKRLEVFEWLASSYDKSVENKEKGGAHVYRMEEFGHARGDVLEVAVGTGRCFEALASADAVQNYIGIDCTEEMLDEARKKLKGCAFPARVVAGDAHCLPFDDHLFDTVIGSLCLCSLEHPDTALLEMARVCRPDGQILLVEPGLCKSRLLRFCQQYLGLVPDPKHAWEFGWHDDLDPPMLVSQCSRLQIKSVKTRALGNWYLITANPRMQTEPESAC
mmetsp:Transcript_45780/g.88049  ORF Transcript_45780/g.88049 Transcript_45780/m.88049 type:complete len:280 (+) Transcript_45780:21-860(+)